MKNLRLLFCLLFVPQAALFAQTNFPFPDADAKAAQSQAH